MAPLSPRHFGWLNRAWRGLTAALLLASLAQPGATPVSAAPARAPQTECALVVSVTSDAGAGSLRDAVGCAVAGDTVTFAGGLAGATISLTTGEIEIQASITIDGSGAPGVMVDAGNSSRIFNISASDPVTLTALILQHGTAALGGAVYSVSDLLLLNQVAVFSSTATTGSGGGGVRTQGAVTLIGGRLQGNACTAGGCPGGGLRANGLVVLTGTVFLSNTSTAYGAGADLMAAGLLTNGRFENNYCTETNCSGGGLHAGAAVTLTGTVFISNTSVNFGGGLYTADVALLSGGRFEANACVSANCTGGGLYAAGPVTLTGTDFISNTSQGNGGGVFGDVAVTLINGRFQANTCTTSNCVGGGLSTYGTLALTGTQFISNTSRGNGGGVYADIGALVNGGLFQANACSQEACWGGGLATYGTAVLTGTQFISNTSQGDGGGVYADNGALISGGQFQANVCSEAACVGGGLATYGTVVLSGTQFLTNTSQGNGGGLYAALDAALANSSFSGNSAGSGSGGGLAVMAGLTATNLTLSGNLAQVAGGAISLTEGVSAQLLNLTLADNTAPSGGALAAPSSATVGVTNTLISNNGAAACAGTIDFGTNNLEWASTSCAVAGPTAGFTNADPLLGPLALNAPGTTLTRALLADSPAIDAGHAATCAGPLVNNRDQRGVTRPLDGDNVGGAVCDIGAYEAAVPVWYLYLPIILR